VDSSTLVGTLTGTTALTQVDAATGRFTGNLNVIVVGGTGEWANANGAGQMVQQQDFPFPTPPAPPLPTGGLPNMPTMPALPTYGLPMERAAQAALLRAIAHQAGNPMKTALVAGKPRARFIAPSGRITRSTDYKVHMAAAPGVSCSVKATKGKITKNFGALRAIGTGQLVSRQRAGALLTTGSWKLTPSCRKSGKTLPASSARTATLRIS
jgi:hypothetical protein